MKRSLQMITNKQLIACREQIFSYNDNYQVPFYGRRKSIAEIKELNANLKPGETIIISQPLGTGKSFLINHMISTRDLNVPVATKSLVPKTIGKDKDVLKSFPGDTIVVDEADIKTPAKKLIEGIKNLADYLDDTGKKAIVIGDYTLHNKDISGALKRRVVLNNFEPIDSDFLRGVLRERFKKFLLDGIDTNFDLNSVIEPALIEYLTPSWMDYANSFRGIFSLLQKLVADKELIKYNSNQAYLTVDMVREMLNTDDNENYDEPQKLFLEYLKQYIKEKYPKGRGINNGFSVKELFQLQMNIDDKTGIVEFEEEILYPLAVSGMLVSTGVPGFSKDTKEFIRRPAPYFPSLELMLLADEL